MNPRYEGDEARSIAEPARDEPLGVLLRDLVGHPPMADVNWPALAGRIGTAVRLQAAAPWWSYAERWQRSALPLALAAGLVGVVALWGSSSAARPDGAPVAAVTDLVSSVVAGSPTADAAVTFARSIAGSIDFLGVQE